MLQTIGKALLVFMLLGVAFVVLLFLAYPMDARIPAQPASSYQEAILRFEAVKAAESGLPLHPGCESQLLTNGAATERVAVLFHGYRSCPLQFRMLGEQLHKMGYTVLLPRMPQMGFESRPNDNHGTLGIDELLQYSTETLDIAQGLGGQVTVVGFSAGGLLAAWAAQYRDDLDRAVMISPFLEPEFLPDAIARPAANLLRVMPNLYVWQDADLKENVPNPTHVYPRNATRPISEFMRLGFALRKAAKQNAPAPDRVVFITNAADDAVDPDPINELIDAWHSQGYESITRFQFEAVLELDHDLIDPRHPRAKTAVSHPILIDSIVAGLE